MDVLVVKDGKQLKFSETPIVPLRFLVSSIQQEDYGKRVEGRAGIIHIGFDDVSRKIQIPFFFKGKEEFDFPLIRDELFSLFGKESFYIAEAPDFEGNFTGKQYQVKISDVIDMDQDELDGRIAQGTLVFETTDSPYAQSILTTQEIQSNGLTIDKYWDFGMGFETVDNQELIYNHKAVGEQSFHVFNAGNVEVHPFESYLKLTIKNVVGSTEMFQITNMTNGSRARISVPVAKTDVWTYDGPNIIRNLVHAAKHTRKNFISLAPGWNTFKVYYCDSADVSFDFGFLYR
ncbi:phage tail domain-containing protein [Enterococcus sp.]|uniref:phage tail domain-containing protein n=1 Tax=Enterococcus sp. TaxID=35783 RepID=UPI003C70CB08